MAELETFEDLIEAYSVTFPLDSWATADLVQLSLRIDEELQKRHDEEVP